MCSFKICKNLLGLKKVKPLLTANKTKSCQKTKIQKTKRPKIPNNKTLEISRVFSNILTSKSFKSSKWLQELRIVISTIKVCIKLPNLMFRHQLSTTRNKKQGRLSISRQLTKSNKWWKQAYNQTWLLINLCRIY